MTNNLKDLKTKEESYFSALHKFTSKLEKIISVWNRIYLNKRLLVDLSLCSFDEDSDNLFLIEKTLNSYSFDYEDIEVFDEKIFKIPYSFINNFEFFEKHLLFIEELYALKDEAKKLSFEDSFYLPYSLSSKLENRFAVDSNILKKSKELGPKIGLLKKNGLDASELLKEHSNLTEFIKTHKSLSKAKIAKIKLRLDRDNKKKRIKRLSVIEERIKVLEMLIGPL